MLGVEPETFAYPCGQKYVGRGVSVKSYVPLAAELFIASRGFMDESANDPHFCDLAQLMGMDMDNAALSGSPRRGRIRSSALFCPSGARAKAREPAQRRIPPERSEGGTNSSKP